MRIIEGMNITPVIQWYHSNGSVVEIGQRIIISDGPPSTSHVKTTSLKFSPVLSDDGGTYTCHARVTVPWMTNQPAVRSSRVSIVVSSKLL